VFTTTDNDEVVSDENAYEGIRDHTAAHIGDTQHLLPSSYGFSYLQSAGIV